MHARTVGRYRLEDLVNEVEGVSLWRGDDEILDQPVSVRAIGLTDPRVESIVAAASAAALIDDTRWVRVLDVVRTDDQLLVVSEWAKGDALNELTESDQPRTIPAEQALNVIREVALALKSGRAHDLAHHRLRPSCVVLTQDAVGGVQVRGLAVDEAMWGSNPAATDSDPDIHGLGALLYWMITARWPAPVGGTAPLIGGRILPPSQVVADVPRVIDELTGRSVIGQRRDEDRYATFEEAANAFIAASDRFNPATATMAIVRPERLSWRRFGTFVFRFVAVLAALAVVGLVAAVGWNLIVNGPEVITDTSASIDTSVLTNPVSAAPIQPGNPIDVAIPIVAAFSHDPFGSDKTENDDLAAYAIDTDAKTSWETDDYSDSEMSGKKGVGLILDLGTTKPVRAVELTMATPGADLEVRVSDTVLKDPVLWTELGSAQYAPQVTTMRVPRPINGRYVLIWFSRLPALDWSYRAEIKSVQVFS